MLSKFSPLPSSAIVQLIVLVGVAEDEVGIKVFEEEEYFDWDDVEEEECDVVVEDVWEVETELEAE